MLSNRLKEISGLKGEFQITDNARRFYDRWYKRYKGRDDLDDRTGSLDRMGDQVLKAAMLISLSAKDELIIEESDMSIAMEKCQECVTSAMRMTPVVGSSNGDRPNAMRYITKYLIEAPEYTIPKALLVARLHKYGIFSDEINKHMAQLMKNGWVRPGRDFANKPYYRLTDEGYRNLIGDNFGEANVH